MELRLPLPKLMAKLKLKNFLSELPISTEQEVKDDEKEGDEPTKADESKQNEDKEPKEDSDLKTTPSPKCAKKKSGFGLSDLSFEELKLEVRRMPAVVTRSKGAGCAERGRSSSEGGVGSVTEHRSGDSMMEIPAFSTTTTTTATTTSRQNVGKNRQKMRQQFSLNDELLSRDRLQANQVSISATLHTVFVCVFLAKENWLKSSL